MYNILSMLYTVSFIVSITFFLTMIFTEEGFLEWYSELILFLLVSLIPIVNLVIPLNILHNRGEIQRNSVSKDSLLEYFSNSWLPAERIYKLMYEDEKITTQIHNNRLEMERLEGVIQRKIRKIEHLNLVTEELNLINKKKRESVEI